MSEVMLISDAAKEVNVENHVLRYWEEELHLPIKRNELGHRYYTKEDVERFKEIKSMKERGLQLKAIKMILKDGRIDVLPQEDFKKLRDAGDHDAKRDTKDTGNRDAGEQRDETTNRDTKNAGEEDTGNRSAKEAGDRNPGERSAKGEADRDPGERSAKGETDRDPRGRFAKHTEDRDAGDSDRRQQSAAVHEKEIMTPQMAINIVDSREAKNEVVQDNKEEKSRRLQWLLQQLIRETLQENNQQLCHEIKESVVKELDYQFRIQEEREEERDKRQEERSEEYYKKMDEILRKKSRKGWRDNTRKDARASEVQKPEEKAKKKRHSIF